MISLVDDFVLPAFALGRAWHHPAAVSPYRPSRADAVMMPIPGSVAWRLQKALLHAVAKLTQQVERTALTTGSPRQRERRV